MGFIRDDTVAIVVPRLNLKRGDVWNDDTRVELPAGPWNNMLSREEVRGPWIRIGELLERFPVALMGRDGI
jgi:maltooligosyltrehalose synthase